MFVNEIYDLLSIFQFPQNSENSENANRSEFPQRMVTILTENNLTDRH